MTNEKWLKHVVKYGACNVENNFNYFFNYLLSRLHRLIEIRGLPESVDEIWLKNNLFLNGMICFTNKMPNGNGKLYALNGNFGGVGDYYEPTFFTIANPNLGSVDVTIGKDCEVVYNSPTDKYFPQGLYQQLVITATMLADNVVSMNTAQINSRVQAIVTADSKAQANTAEIVLKRLYSGEPYNIMTQDMLEKISVNPIARQVSTITDLIELHQYIEGSFWNDLGVQFNTVNKKERLITDEIQAQQGYEKLSIETIRQSWSDGFDRVNKMFGTNITVEINPILEECDEDVLVESAYLSDDVSDGEAVHDNTADSDSSS